MVLSLGSVLVERRSCLAWWTGLCWFVCVELLLPYVSICPALTMWYVAAPSAGCITLEGLRAPCDLQRRSGYKVLCLANFLPLRPGFGPLLPALRCNHDTPDRSLQVHQACRLCVTEIAQLNRRRDAVDLHSKLHA
jgi:hypothetical protein